MTKVNSLTVHNMQAVRIVKAILVVVIIFVLLMGFLIESMGQIAPGYQIATWSQFKTAAVSYTLDDDCTNQLPIAVPMFDKYNYKVTLFTVIDWNPNWPGLLAASNNGHEIGSHTNTHPTLNTISVSSQNTELGQSQATINSKIPNVKCVTVAYPNCVEGDLPTIKSYYIAGRTCNNQVELATPNDFYDVGSIITGTLGVVHVAADFNAKVAAAKASKGWCVFLTHGIDNDGGYSPTVSTEIQSHLVYMNTNIADFWIATFGNVIKYIQERNISSLTETSITSDSLKLVVANNLDNTIYNVPITISRTLPTGWKTPKVYIGGKLATSTLSTVNGTTSIIFDVVPNQGNIYLANTLAVVATPAPTVISPVVYCQGTTANALTATGTALKWYNTSTGGTASSTAPVPSTASVGTIDYYVTQTLGGIESTPRTLIAVTVNTLPSPPTVTSPVIYCQNAAASALTASGTSLNWYTASIGGTASTTVPTPSTASAGSTNYYVSQTANGCESPRALITVTINGLPSVPVVTSSVTYCQNATASVLTASGTSLNWYTVSTGGTASTTALTPSTASAGSTNYYVSQTANGCESPRALITVTINGLPSVPVVTSSVTYCQNATASALTATGTSLNWYTASTGGTASTTVPTPSTVSVGSTNYYVSQTVNGCESARALITVTTNALPSAPVVKSPVTYCQNVMASVLTASGTSLNWYTVSTGGTASTTAPTPSTASAGSTNYYVSQTANGCESSRALITVTVNTLPSVPVIASPVTYCQNAAASVLTATGASLNWYTAATGGTASTIAPTPSTASVGSINYYVSQTTNGCESSRALITVTTNALPVATISSGSNTTFCSGGSVLLTSTVGSSYVWMNGSTQVGTNQAYTVETAGSYTVQVTNASACTKSSLPVVVTVTAPLTWYADEDGDGKGDPNVMLMSCTQPSGYVAVAGDACPFDPNKIVPGNCGCGKTEQSCLDCAGVPNGSAVKDSCGNCVGGTTGLIACSITTGITGSSIVSGGIIVYPQPFEYTTKIELKNEGLIESVMIYSSTGSLVYMNDHVNQISIEIGADLSEGLYTAIIQTGKAIYSARIVKIK
jgi:hypothetical protein